MPITKKQPLVTIAESLVQLAHELSQQAALDLAATQRGQAAAAAALDAGSSRDVAARMLALRRLRKTCMPAMLFHEPAWEIMLVLYAHDDAGRAMNLKELSSLVDAPFTTTQRWVDQMVRMGLIARVEAPQDRRQVELSLSAQGRNQLDDYFAAVGSTAEQCQPS